MPVVDITTMANYFGRVTGIARSEAQIARALGEMGGDEPRYVYWSNHKNSFEEYRALLEFDAVKSAKLGYDFTIPSAGPTQLSARLRPPEVRSFIVTGSGWLQNTVYTLGCIEYAADAGLKLAFYVHDLIPSLFPYYYDATYVERFEKNLSLICRHADLLACNSENTRRDLLAWCERKGIEAPETVVALLGDDIEPPGAAAAGEKDGEAGEEDLVEGLGDGDLVLAVGAIHRRKNYELLTHVWRRLAARMGGRCPTLAIVGGVTSDGKVLADEIARDPVLARRIRLLKGVDDEKLGRLYKAAKLVVYPSRYEGWGLPIAEALAQGRICIASNTSAMPEVADLGPDSLAPDDVGGWANRIMFYLQSPNAREAREAELPRIYRRRHWKDTARTIVEALETLERKPPPLLYPGQRIDLSQAHDNRDQAFLASRSYGPETWGRWFCGDAIRLRFRLPPAAIGAPAEINLSALRKQVSQPLRVLLNGRVLLERKVEDGESLSVVVPADVAQSENLLVLQGSEPTEMAENKRKPWSMRYADLGLSAIDYLTPEQALYARRERARLDIGRPVRNASSVLLDAMDRDVGVRIWNPVITDFGPTGTLKIRFPSDWLAQVEQETSDSRKRMLWLRLQLAEPCPVRLTVRSGNGPAADVLADQPNSGGYLTPRSDGELTVPLQLDTSLHQELEVIVLDAEKSRPIHFALASIFASSALLPMVAMRRVQDWPAVDVDQYIRFDAEETGDIFSPDWSKTSLGMGTTGLGLLRLRIGSGPKPRLLKLYMKARGAKEASFIVQVNDRQTTVRLPGELVNTLLPIDDTLHEGDFMTVAIAPTEETRRQPGTGRGARREVGVILRAIQLLK